MLISSFMGFAWVEGAQDCPDRAAQLLGAASALIDITGFKLRPVDVAEYERTAGMVRNAMGDAQYDAAWGSGRAMSIQQAITLALDEAMDGGR